MLSVYKSSEFFPTRQNHEFLTYKEVSPWLLFIVTNNRDEIRKQLLLFTQFQAYILYVQRITPDQQNLANKITHNLTSWLRDFYLLVVKNHKLACSYLACSLVTFHSIKYEVNNVISNVPK